VAVLAATRHVAVLGSTRHVAVLGAVRHVVFGPELISVSLTRMLLATLVSPFPSPPHTSTSASYFTHLRTPPHLHTSEHTRACAHTHAHTHTHTHTRARFRKRPLLCTALIGPQSQLSLKDWEPAASRKLKTIGIECIALIDLRGGTWHLLRIIVVAHWVGTFHLFIGLLTIGWCLMFGCRGTLEQKCIAIAQGTFLQKRAVGGW
jgi:hypothetical protein